VLLLVGSHSDFDFVLAPADCRSSFLMDSYLCFQIFAHRIAANYHPYSYKRFPVYQNKHYWHPDAYLHCLQYSHQDDLYLYSVRHYLDD
jgi:hypothetical protein